MSSQNVHFEVYFKASPTHSWRMLAAKSTRDEALKEAQAALAGAPKASVRVSRETFDEDQRAFRSMTVFEEGGERFGAAKPEENESILPCASAADLSASFTRTTIARVLKHWLERESVIVLELLHRVDLVERLEAAEAELQHAVQKFSIARAGSSAAPVQKVVKDVNALIQSAVKQLYADTRAGVFPALKPGGLGDLASKLAPRSDRARVLRGAVVQRLKGARDWKSKLEMALDVADEAHKAADDAAWVGPLVAEFVDDVLEVDGARLCLFKATPRDRGHEAEALTALFRGADEEGHLSALGVRLAAMFIEGRFERVRVALGRRALAILKDPRRLRPTSFNAEVTLSRRLADQLIASSLGLLPVEDIVEAFVARSGCLLQNELVDEMVRARKDETDGLRALFELEANIVGEQNKAKLASFIRGRLGMHAVATHFIHGSEPVLHRLAVLTEMQGRLKDASFEASDRQDVLSQIDTLAEQAIEAEQLFAKIERRAMPVLEKAAALLRLAAKGVLPAGRVTEDAKARAKRLLATSEARQALASGDPAAKKTARDIALMMKQLEPQRAA